MKDKPSKAGRRGFLVGAGAAGVAGAAAIAGKGLPQAQVAPATKPDAGARGGGYHVTEHVRSYYRTTLV